MWDFLAEGIAEGVKAACLRLLERANIQPDDLANALKALASQSVTSSGSVSLASMGVNGSGWVAGVPNGGAVRGTPGIRAVTSALRSSGVIVMSDGRLAVVGAAGPMIISQEGVEAAFEEIRTKSESDLENMAAQPLTTSNQKELIFWAFIGLTVVYAALSPAAKEYLQGYSTVMACVAALVATYLAISCRK